MPEPRTEGPFSEIRDILPKLAINVGWLKLIDEVHCEQTKRQSRKELSVSPEGKAHAARKASARSIARSKRRGYYGLARAILDKQSAA